MDCGNRAGRFCATPVIRAWTWTSASSSSARHGCLHPFCFVPSTPVFLHHLRCDFDISCCQLGSELNGLRQPCRSLRRRRVIHQLFLDEARLTYDLLNHSSALPVMRQFGLFNSDGERILTSMQLFPGSTICTSVS